MAGQRKKQIFGDTDGIRAKAYKYPLDAKSLVRLGKACAKYSKIFKGHNGKVLIGRDTRESGEMIEKNLCKGFTSQGLGVDLAGIIPTPATSFLTKNGNYSLGIMITASHNPFTDNGIKVFKPDGSKTNDEEELEIERLFFKNSFGVASKRGRVGSLESAGDIYEEVLLKIIGKLDLSGLRIVVDTANGAAYKIAPKIYKKLGAEVFVTHNRPNGRNINKDCGVLHPKILAKEVLAKKADLGIAFDGDADRLILIDEKGSFIDGDYIMALIVSDMKKKGTLKNNGTVITNYSNLALEKYYEKIGVKTEKVVVGDKFVAELCHKRGYNFGGEITGHFMFLDISDIGDGILTSLEILQILGERGKKLSEIAKPFVKYPQKQYNIPVVEKKPLEELPAFTVELKEWEEKMKNTGRVFVRYSGTQNIIRVMVEDKNMEMVESAGRFLSDLIFSLIGDPDEQIYVANE